MDIEYKITCVGVEPDKLLSALRSLPSPISRPEMREIYNYRVERDGYYFVDRGVHAATAAQAFRVFVDAAITAGAPRVEVARL